MFEESLVESAALLRTRNRWPAVLSLTAQCAVAALVVSLPLLHPELLPMPHILPATLATPRPPVPPPPPIHIEARSPAASSAPAAPGPTRTTALQRSLIHLSTPAVDAPALPAVNLGDPHSSVPPGVNTAAPASPVVSVATAAKTTSKPMPVSSGVSAGNLIAPIRPEYPQIARITRTEGTVVIDAVISRTGFIERAQVLSGPPMLQAAALASVRQARYHPFLLNGQPTEVQTTVTIVFRMGS
jgi:protein TonB